MTSWPDTGRQARVVIRGIGIRSSLGSGRAAAIAAGAEPPAAEATSHPQIRVRKGDVSATDRLLPKRKLKRLLTRSVQWGVVAAADAFADARADEYPCPSERLGVFAGGLLDYEELTHVHSVMREIRERGFDWGRDFGRVAVRLLPPFMLLRQLPNALFCHVAHQIAARGYNATVLNGQSSALDSLRFACLAIAMDRLDAALVVVSDSPIRWEHVTLAARLDAGESLPVPVVLTEAGVALYVERAGLHPEREQPAYAEFGAGCSRQARRLPLDRGQGADLVAAARSVREAMRRVVEEIVGAAGAATISRVEVGHWGIDWLDSAESAALSALPQLAGIRPEGLAVSVGCASGGVGLARLAFALAEQSEPAAGLVLRASPTGQCSGVLLKSCHPI